MKRQVFAASAMVLCSLAVGAVQSSAQQIFNQFRQPTLEVGRPYRDLDFCPQSRIAKRVLAPSAFVLPPTNVNDLDDGYARIDFPQSFRFNYNGTVHSSVFVSVNGFITFDNTKLVPAKQSVGLFTNSSSYPDNAIAPFWGDHKLRVNADIPRGYQPTEISWAIDVDRNETCDTIKYTRTNPTTGAQETFVRRCLIVQWKSLNINDSTVNSSVANFQARLYEATETDNNQGDIEFAYGQVAGNPFTSNTTVVTRGATVGIKGSGGFPGFLSDFWNGLLYSPALGANARTDSTSAWQPSGGRSDAVIRFSAIPRFTQDIWGFGDANFSGVRGQKHFGLAQNRIVTMEDARVIMRSIVTRQFLDSVWKRQAYQGDVTHSGRFYFTKLNRAFTGDSIVAGQTIVWRRTIDVDQFTGQQVRRDLFEGDGLYGVGGRAPDISALNQIYYEVTEYDAATIIKYIRGGLPFLPWVRDNDTPGVDFGKVGNEIAATNVRFGTATHLADGSVRVPVFLNGVHDGAFGARFASNVEILDVTPVQGSGIVVNPDFTNDVAVVTGHGQIDPNVAVAYVTFKSAPEIRISDIRFNERNRADVTLNLVESTEQGVLVTPNPMTTSAAINVTVPETGNVVVRVFNTYGDLVATLFDGVTAAGTLPLTWNGTNGNGQSVAQGAYVVRVDAVGNSTSTRVNVVR
jgi:hypothetical protein